MDKMSEDEKKAIDMLEKYITEHKFYNIKQSDGLEDNIKILLDLYMQEKEKNKKLQIRCKELIEEKQELNTALLYDNISKDKIKEKIESIENTLEVCDEEINYRLKIEDKAKKEVLKELLED